MGLSTQLNRLANWLEQRSLLARPWRRLRYVALDVETTGLDASTDTLLALAWVNIEPPLMDYGSAQYHVLARAEQLDLKQSPIIHGLRQADFTRSSEPRQTLKVLSRVLNDAVLVCHNVQLDWQFLQQAARKYDVTLKPAGFYDTLKAEHKRLQQKGETVQRDMLTLATCRKRYGLPEYGNHHAFSDAIGCGELFLAQAYRYFGGANVRARQVLRSSR